MKIKKIIFLALTFLAALQTSCADHHEDKRVFELRIYQASEGRRPELEARFRDHTSKFFKKHGIESVGFWIPAKESDNRFIYILSHASRQSRSETWKSFKADPEWKTVFKASKVNGKLVDQIESRFMTATDYFPSIKSVVSDPERVFELRIYTAKEGLLPNINNRFRDATIPLFKKHGIQIIGFWNLMDDQERADRTLIYMLAHDSREAAKASWESFLEDPEWIAAKAASQEGIGRLIIEKGINRTYLNPLDFSPIK